MRRLFLLTLLLGSPADGAERSVSVGSFDRLRVSGEFNVRVTTGGSPRATLSGSQAELERVDVRVQGTTLSLSRRSGRGEPIVVTLSVPALQSATVLGPGRVTIAGLRASRAALAVTGPGSIAVTGAQAEELAATVVGEGQVALAGRAGHLRLMTNGSGSIDADALDADDVLVRLDGIGETRARARYLANVSSTGAGKVRIAGKPKCTVRAAADSAATCGAP